MALIGNRSVLFDFEDDENESYHKNMFESDDIEGGEKLQKMKINLSFRYHQVIIFPWQQFGNNHSVGQNK